MRGIRCQRAVTREHHEKDRMLFALLAGRSWRPDAGQAPGRRTSASASADVDGRRVPYNDTQDEDTRWAARSTRPHVEQLGHGARRVLPRKYDVKFGGSKYRESEAGAITVSGVYAADIGPASRSTARSAFAFTQFQIDCVALCGTARAACRHQDDGLSGIWAVASAPSSRKHLARMSTSTSAPSTAVSTRVQEQLRHGEVSLQFNF